MENQKNGLVKTQQDDKAVVEYEVAGQLVKLSYQIVRDFLTKGSGNVSDQDLTQFISICKYNQLNPFLNEAYLIKFGTSPAQMIVSKEAFFKRADANENYDGIQSGIIVIRDGNEVDLNGCFYRDTDKLAGGWAIVYRKDKKYPIISRVRLSEYDKKQSSWNEKPSTMICKIAKVQALREAFPAQLGALYTKEEQTIDIPFEDVTAKENKEPLQVKLEKKTEEKASVQQPEPQVSQTPEPVISDKETESQKPLTKAEQAMQGINPNPGF